MRPERFLPLLATALICIATPRLAMASWPSAGTPVCVLPGTQEFPLTAPSSDGGLVVVWDDDRSGVFACFAQRMTPSGDVLPGWPVGGKFVAAATEGAEQLLSDGSGGFYLVFLADGQGLDVYVQHCDSIGDQSPGWPGEGSQSGPDPGT